MLKKIENRAYKARSDLLNPFYSPWEFEGKESQNDQLRLIWNIIWACLGAVIIVEPRNNQINENQSIRGWL